MKIFKSHYIDFVLILRSAYGFIDPYIIFVLYDRYGEFSISLRVSSLFLKISLLLFA